MSGINTGKVIAGGLVAGLVANIVDGVTNTFILESDWQALAVAHNIDPGAMMSPAAIATWIGVDFLLGIILVWTYAAIRPRLGPGPGTAISAGLVVYLSTTLVVFGFTMMGMLTLGLFVKGALAAVVSILGASVAGAAVYRE